MTLDEIIEMARQAGLSVTAPSWGYTEDYHFQGYEDKLKAFAKLVAEREREKLKNIAFFNMWYQEMNAAVLAEREACAKECEHTALRMGSEWMAAHCAEAIRARGQA